MSFDKNKFHVSLKITNTDFDPLEISKRLSVEPTGAWKKGEYKVLKRGRVKILTNTWELKSELPVQVDDLNLHIENILNKFQESELLEVTKSARSFIFCRFYFYEPNVGFTLIPRLLKNFLD